MGHVIRIGGMRNTCKVFIGRPEGRKPLERRRLRWQGNIKMDLTEIGWKLWTGCIWIRVGISGGFL